MVYFLAFSFTSTGFLLNKNSEKVINNKMPRMVKKICISFGLFFYTIDVEITKRLRQHLKNF